MWAFLGALVGGLFSAAGGVASAVGTLGAGALGLAGGLVSGVGGLVFGPGLTVGQQMAAIAEPAYYETAGAGILGGITASAVKTVDYFGNLAPTALGIYQQLSPAEKIEAPATARAVLPKVTPIIARTVIPTLSQQPKIMTVGAVAESQEPNYLLYIGLAVLALFLLRKK